MVAIVQARLGSIRMPSKVLKKSAGHPLITHLLDRLKKSTLVSEVVVAIPSSGVNDELAELVLAHGSQIFRGSELDVLDRFVATAKIHPAEAYVRITGDCPMIDPGVVDQVIDLFLQEKLDYACTGTSYPDGFDVEVFRAEKLFEAGEQARENYDREHVTPYIKRAARTNSRTLEYRSDLSDIRLTVDEPEDFGVMDSIFQYFGPKHFGIDDIEALVVEKPDLFLANQHLQRNAGAQMKTGEKLWARAKRVIPGGGMLLSKRAEMFVPSGWPAYFSRTKGCQVWDLDGNTYLDLGYMGIGTNILGYSHPNVDEAAARVVRDGNLSTLNSPEEVYLAERLTEMHPWASMARFTRSGGEACAVAVRIARAASGKSKVAFCGYHGWHDWYLSANLSVESALDSHLLAGLAVEGVPPELAGTSIPFRYNDLEELQRVLSTGDIGVIMMEVERNTPPLPGYLEEVRALADRFGAVLVFDECTSGFRREFGGLHLGYGVEPDIAVLGKTLGNGYAVNAIIGRQEVMSAANRTFISSTFWTERIGAAAALAALDAMELEGAPREVEQIGLRVRESWESIARNNGLAIKIQGLPALSTFELDGFSQAHLKAYFVSEMLGRGYLVSTAFYASLAHTPEIVEKYLGHVDAVLARVSALGPEGVRAEVGSGGAGLGFARLN